MRKKIVWLPYDFDTAIGINNEGELVFSYDLQDTDTYKDDKNEDKDVYNGQKSVFWNNLRDAFKDELQQMYQQLRNSKAWSYDKIEKMFEEHQGKWSEAIFNKDAQYKYIDPLINGGYDENGEWQDSTAMYLPMLLGSKEQQRKWWLYNRFRYIDSKYIAGDALTDYIDMRAYAKANITVTPYADIYPTVRFGAYTVQNKGKRGVPTVLQCPVDRLNDTETQIFSASQLLSVGDLSPLKIGRADFSKAVKLTQVKVGDGDSQYSNSNLINLNFGNNTLLQRVDARNCPRLTQAISFKNCNNIKELYFEGTSVTGIILPNGSLIEHLHLPGTITNLTLVNQKNLIDFVCPSYENITTLHVENALSNIDTYNIVSNINNRASVRIINFNWTLASQQDFYTLRDKIDAMTGLNQYGEQIPNSKPQLSGIIRVPQLTSLDIQNFKKDYPYVDLIANRVLLAIYYYNYDGSELLHTESINTVGGNGTWNGQPARESSETDILQYTFVGWSRNKRSTTADSTARSNITQDRDVYAAYSTSFKKFTVNFYSDDTKTTLITSLQVNYNESPNSSSLPTSYNGQTITAWRPEPKYIQGPMDCVAQYRSLYTVTFKNGYGSNSVTLDTVSKVLEGDACTYGKTTPVYRGYIGQTLWSSTSPTASDYIDPSLMRFVGWDDEAGLARVTKNLTVYAVFEDTRSLVTRWLQGQYQTEQFIDDESEKLGAYALYESNKIKNIYINANEVEQGAFPYLNTSNINRPLKNIYFTKTNMQELIYTTNAFDDNINSNNAPNIFIESEQVPICNSQLNYSYLFSDNNDYNYSIFVKDEFLNNYKNNLDWGYYKILPKSKYKTSGSYDYNMDEDGWESIIASINNGTYKTKYRIGDVQKININNIDVYVQLIAFDTDDLSDNSGKAPTTWMMRFSNDSIRHNMDDIIGSLDAWGSTRQGHVRQWLITSILPGLRANLGMDVIKEVKKTYYNYHTQSTQTINDEIWVPSYRQIVGTDQFEDSGCTYSNFFMANDKYNLKAPNIGSFTLRTQAKISSGGTYYYGCIESGNQKRIGRIPENASYNGSLYSMSDETYLGTYGYNYLKIGFCI